MAAEIAESTEVRPPAPGWRQWLQLAAAALVLLTASEALWLWQTWPVRELLHAPAPVAANASAR